MEEEKNEIAEESDEFEELDDVEETDTTDWKAEAQKLREKAIAQRERTKLLKEQVKALTPKKEEAPAKTGELDETQLDYLDVKGITDQDEIDIISKVIAKTGQTVRQALKDDYVTSKLEALRADKAVKDATPSSTKRSGNQQGDLAGAIAKFDANGELPNDFTLRSAVVNAISSRSQGKPNWH